MRVYGRQNKFLFIFAFLLFGSLLISPIVNAEYIRSNPQYTSPGFILGSSSYDRSLCSTEGADFVLSIAPTGCEPVPVRSDLLEEQDVYVYCPIVATQINPLINVDALDSITITGDYPREVSSVGFYPSQSALGGIDGSLNNPALNNLGYAVVSLRRQANESAMPDFVEGNLTATLRYDIKNAFGIGRAVFYLPVLNDDEWEQRYGEYGFWNGKGYLRATAVESDTLLDLIDNEERASLTIYSDISSPSSNFNTAEVSSVTLEKGETSQSMYLPGVGFCTANLQLRLDDVVAPDTYVKLDVNSEIYQLTEGSKFLDNKCTVRSIDKQGLVQRVDLSCRGDEKISNFELLISPRVNISVNGSSKSVEVGDVIYDFEGNNEKRVFLGYIGQDEKGRDFIVPVISSARDKNEFLGTAAYKTGIPFFVKTVLYGKDKGALATLTAETVKTAIGVPVIFATFAASGTAIIGLNYIGEDSPELSSNILSLFSKMYESVTQADSIPKVFKNNLPKIIFMDFAEPVDRDIFLQNSPPQAGNTNNSYVYLQKAIDDYETIRTSFRADIYPPGSNKTLGEESLFNLIQLLDYSGQKRTLIEYCDMFEENYGHSFDELRNGVCKKDYTLSSNELSSRSIVIDGQVRSISLLKITEPSVEDYSVEVFIEGAGDYGGNKIMGKNSGIYLSETEFVTLKELDTKYAVFDISGVNQSGFKESTIKSSNLKVDLNDFRVFGSSSYKITVRKINLNKMAKVTVNPNIDYSSSKAEFSFKIGIEKRNIELSPEQIQSKINSLDSKIETFKSISDTLGGTVKTLKTACLVTGAALTAKNFLENAGGVGIARQNVMRGPNGWYERCQNEASSGAHSGSVERCLLENSDEIERDVNKYKSIMDEQNGVIETLQNRNSEDSLTLDKIVNTNGFMEEYIPRVRNTIESSSVSALENPSNGNAPAISRGEVLEVLTYDSYKNGNFGVEKLRDIEFHYKMLGSDADEELKTSSMEQAYLLVTDIKKNSQNYLDSKTFSEETGMGASSYVGAVEKLHEFQLSERKRARDTKYNSAITSNSLKDLYAFSWKNRADSKEYLFLYDIDGSVNTTYLIEGSGNSLSLIQQFDNKNGPNPFRVYFKLYDSSSYKNSYNNPEVRYYETAPYKGFPAIVPFDTNNGWYVATKAKISVSEDLNAYDSSGRVNSFYLCNVGRNGNEEFFSNIGDDICSMVNFGTNQPYDQFYGLTTGEATSLVTKARSAIEQAQDGYPPRDGRISINGKILKVGEPATNIPSIQCEDFMSPKECSLIFNVCDPVVCPSSRCDFGGNYPVQDVVQTGIVGGMLMCLPNYKDGIYLPVCLSGIKAGFDGLISVEESYKQCLEENLKTGKTVGICDEIHSVYACEFVWKQSLPLAKLAIPKVLSALLGQNVRGGGEYLGVQNAVQNVDGVVDYFTQYYAENSFKAFKLRSVDEAGTEVCRNYVSIAYPSSADVIDSLTDPDSPPQYHGRFDEIPYTTATNPPTSQYKVFYHIYAGSDSGAYYQVYLKGGATSSFYQDTSAPRAVNSGFIPAGEYASETKDFTAPSGYSQLCISVNGEESCGYKQVSTSFAVNFLKDEYLSEQASSTSITSTRACVSGQASMYSVLNPNLESTADELIDPEIYNRGITRICATNNPGSATDTRGVENSRWVEVGYCDEPALKCWLDMDSVDRAIEFKDAKAYTEETVRERYINSLIEENKLLGKEEFDTLVKEIEGTSDFGDKLDLIVGAFDSVLLNSHKGKLYLMRGQVYDDLFRTLTNFELDKDSLAKDETDITKSVGRDGSESGSGDGRTSDIFSDERLNELESIPKSPVFELKDGDMFSENLNFQYVEGEGWKWSKNGVDWNSVKTLSELIGDREIEPSSGGAGRTIPNVELYSSEQDVLTEHPSLNPIEERDSFSDYKKEILERLNGASYEEGVGVLIEMTILNKPGFLGLGGFVLSTGDVELSSNGFYRMTFNNIDKQSLGLDVLFLEYREDENSWIVTAYPSTSAINPNTNPANVPGGDVLSIRLSEGGEAIPRPFNKIPLLERLRDKEFYEGGLLIFSNIDKSVTITSDYSCDSLISCQTLVGNEIVKIASLVKDARSREIDDTEIKKQTGAENFECLVLQVASHESALQHCKTYRQGDNPLYCNGDLDNVLKADGTERSYGVMQINLAVHGNVDVEDFETNVEYGANYLVNNFNMYKSSEKKFFPNGKTYTGWEAALRQYNGWSETAEKGDVNYVENVEGKNDEIKALFPNFC